MQNTMQQMERPKGFPTREALLSAFDEMFQKYDNNEYDRLSDEFPTRAAELCGAAMLCGYLSVEDQYDLEVPYREAAARGEEPKLIQFQHALYNAIKRAGEPGDTPKPVTFDRTEAHRHSLLGQLQTVIGVVRRTGNLDWAVPAGAMTVTMATVAGFVTMEEVIGIAKELHPEMKRGSGTVASFIETHERIADLIAKSTRVAPDLVEVVETVDGPKDEYPQPTAVPDVQTNALASAMFGGTHQQSRRSRTNSPVA